LTPNTLLDIIHIKEGAMPAKKVVKKPGIEKPKPKYPPGPKPPVKPPDKKKTGVIR
jgi:hypothetical protein